MLSFLSLPLPRTNAFCIILSNAESLQYQQYASVFLYCVYLSYKSTIKCHEGVARGALLSIYREPPFLFLYHGDHLIKCEQSSIFLNTHMLIILEERHLAASNWYRVAFKLFRDQWDLAMERQRERGG